jgi:hypothetical protein
MTSIFDKLSAPLEPSKVSWRVGQITKSDPTKASALCYIDARDVMERLDRVVGPDNWKDSYYETPKGRIICTISIYSETRAEWVSKSDAAGDTAVEAEKGAVSDAFKRAAVKWGIGRYLYDIPMQWVQVDQYKKIVKSEYAKLQRVLPGSRVDDHDAAPTPPLPPVPEPKADDSDWPAWIEAFKSDFLAAGVYLAAQEYWSSQSATLKDLRAERPQAYAALVSWAKAEGDKLPKSAA